MKHISKILTATSAIFLVAAGVVFAILNPHSITVNLWGFATVEQSMAAWLIIAVAVGVLVGVLLALSVIVRQQSQLRACKRSLAQTTQAPLRVQS